MYAGADAGGANHSMRARHTAPIAPTLGGGGGGGGAAGGGAASGGAAGGGGGNAETAAARSAAAWSWSRGSRSVAE